MPRCALTAPFHPYRENRGGIFSVALALGSPPAAVSSYPVLWCPDFPRGQATLSYSSLTNDIIAVEKEVVKGKEALFSFVNKL